MARLWHDEYWLMLLQLFLKDPPGVKPLYSKGLVDLALETHIKPVYLYNKMFAFRQINTPMLQALWNKYANEPRKLSAELRRIRSMEGFGHAEEFYEGVEATRDWEADFLPVNSDEKAKGRAAVTPAKLIIVLDLYFRLVPDTMVPGTPEVRRLARIIKLKPQQVAAIMRDFQACDPFLAHNKVETSPLYEDCKKIWARFGNDSPEKLNALAAQLRQYWA